MQQEISLNENYPNLGLTQMKFTSHVLRHRPWLNREIFLERPTAEQSIGALTFRRVFLNTSPILD